MNKENKPESFEPPGQETGQLVSLALCNGTHIPASDLQLICCKQLFQKGNKASETRKRASSQFKHAFQIFILKTGSADFFGAGSASNTVTRNPWISLLT